MHSSICKLIHLEPMFLQPRRDARGSREGGERLVVIGRVGGVEVVGSGSG